MILRPVLMILLVAVVLACARHHIQPLPAPEGPSASGRVGFQFIANPTAGVAQVEHQEFVTPTPQRALTPPEYPAGPLLANAPHYSVAIRIVIDTDGHVTSVVDSPLQASTAGPFASDFRAAVESAVHRWRFQPGHIDQLEEGDDVDGDGKPDYVRVVKRDPVSVFYDVRFDFEIVAGRARVMSSATP